MAAETSLLNALEDVVQNGSASRRAEMLQQITDLFVNGAEMFNDEHVQLFDDVFKRLIAEIEEKARVQLSVQLADVENAPPEVVRRLAQDDNISVAGPVLQRSGRLEETDLLDLAKSKGQAHLLAIANRDEIGDAVTDVIVRRGDRDVVRNVAANPGARLSRAGYATLVKRAETDGVLAEKVGQRADVPTETFQKLLSQATEVVQKRLLATAAPETQAEIRRVLAAVSSEVESTGAPRDYSAARTTVQDLQRRSKLNEDLLVAFAEQGRFEETVVGLALVCKLPFEIVERIMASDRTDPVLIMCKGAGFGWPTAHAILKIRAKGNGIASHSLGSAHRNFERLSVATAHRVIKFWHSRHVSGGSADI
jgi:uncharacterized protein (DUF2336 family)